MRPVQWNGRGEALRLRPATAQRPRQALPRKEHDATGGTSTLATFRYVPDQRSDNVQRSQIGRPETDRASIPAVARLWCSPPLLAGQCGRKQHKVGVTDARLRQWSRRPRERGAPPPPGRGQGRSGDGRSRSKVQVGHCRMRSGSISSDLPIDLLLFDADDVASSIGREAAQPSPACHSRDPCTLLYLEPAGQAIGRRRHRRRVDRRPLPGEALVVADM